MHLYLDAVGGVAGDMFAAAMLDAWPDLRPGLSSALEAAGLGRIVRVAVERHCDGVLTGTRFVVAPAAPEHPGHPAHRRYAELAQWLAGVRLAPAVRARAADILRLLAEAEAKVHSVALSEVTLHEVGAWDSVTDVVSAAWLIEAVGSARWFASPLPMGRGRVRTAHGELPLPAPATALLLEGFPLVQDGLEGERVTPTGGAILRHLAPSFEPMGHAGRLLGAGIGFGARRLAGLSNVLRVLRFEPAPALPGLARETLGVCQFEVDDQSPEDLALALERLRATPGVKDVVQIPGLGKKGRLTVHVQALVDQDHLPGAVESALRQTSTLGVRWQVVSRTVLERTQGEVQLDGHPVRVKRVVRPGGEVTVKAEDADVAGATTYAQRKRRRAAAEHAARDAEQPVPADVPRSENRDVEP